MRVLVLSAWEPWRLYDGASLILHHQLPLLAAAHDISVVTVAGPAPHDDSERDLRDTYRAPGRIPVTTIPSPEGPLGGVRRRLKSVVSGEPAHVNWVERPGFVAAACRELDRLRPDLLHLHGWGTAQLHRLAPVVPSVHVPVDAWVPGVANRAVSALHRLSDVGQRRLVAAHEARHYPHHTAVVVVAERDAVGLRQRVPGCRVVVVRNGVDAGPKPAPEAWAEVPRPVLAFHGVFTTRANLDAARVLVDEVLPLARRSRPDVTLLLIGRGADREVRALRRPGVEVVGAVPDVRPHLERAAVYVAPLVTGTGIKNKVLEAMAAGLPVVATSRGLEGVGTGPGTFPAETAAAMAEAMLALLGDPGASSRSGRAARARVLAEFSWERNAAELEAVWSDGVAHRELS